MYKRKNYGTLSKEDFKSLNTFLNNSNFKPKADFSIIQYHPGKDRCNGGNFFGNRYNRGYLKKMKRKMQFNNYWIHKKDSKLNFMQPRGIDWQLDINQIVENIFFKHHYPCSSFIIIDNRTKSYISIFGEYGDYHVIEVAEEMIKKTKTSQTRKAYRQHNQSLH